MLVRYVLVVKQRSAIQRRLCLSFVYLFVRFRRMRKSRYLRIDVLIRGKILQTRRGYRSTIEAKIADERNRYDLARRSSRLMATRQPCTFVGSPRKDGSRKLANDLARAGSSRLTMANEAIHRNIRGLGSDRAYDFVSKVPI